MHLRLLQVRKALKLTQIQMAKKLGYSGSGGYSMIESGHVIMPESKIMLLDHLGINITWLKTGDGEMFRSNDYKISELTQVVNDSQPELIKLQTKYIDRLEEENKKLKEEIQKLKKV